MNDHEIDELLQKQKQFFQTGRTLDVQWRLQQLIRLKIAVQSHVQELQDALKADLGRAKEEAYLTDIGPLVMEINEAIQNCRRWAKEETHFSGLAAFPGLITKVYKMPYGSVLIISPFNFPVLLSLGVLVPAIAAGNTAVIKMSSKSTHCTEAVKKMISQTFPQEYVTAVDGGHDTADRLLAKRFDKIFYTGSPAVGKHVLAMAAENLVPAALELGGETGNWCIIRKDADLKDAARKIAFFKMCNAGQICININQVAVAAEVRDAFIQELIEAFDRQLPDALSSEEYPCLISTQAYDRCAAEAEEYRDRIVYGGYGNRETRKYAPTLICPVSIDEPVVMHELFNPLLPVVEYRDEEINDLLKTIGSREHGLALYLFTKDTAWAKKTMASMQYGGGCINEVCMHLTVRGVPFNGTGHSGMGAYHGEWGYREFSHPSTVFIGSSKFNLSLREHPYSGRKNAWKYQFMKIFER